MNVREMYEYTFYKIYKSMDFVMPWGADWRAGGVLLGLSTIFFVSLDLYCELIMNFSLYPTGYEIFVPIGILYGLDYFIFYSRNQWKDIVTKYDAWHQKKNFIGTLVVWSIIALVVINFTVVIYFHDRIG